MIAIKKGVIATFGTKILVAFLGLCLVVLISKYLGAEGRGILSLFTLYIALLQMVCDFGSSSAIINLSYKYANKNLWFTANIWVISICTIAVVIFLFYQPIPFIIFVPICTLLLCFTNINNLLLMGNRAVIKRNINLVLQPLLLLLFFLILYFVFNLKTNSYIIAFIASTSILTIISYIFIQKYIVFKPPFKFEKNVLAVGFWAQSGHFIQFLTYRVNFLLIAYFLGKASVGIYSNAVLIGETLWIFGHSLGQIMHLKILNTDSIAFQRKLTLKFTLINLLITASSFLIIYSLPTTFWTQIFSVEFTAIKSLLKPLALGILVFSCSNILNHYFHAQNKFKLIVLTNSIGLAFCLVTAYFLIPLHGLNGAAWAWSIGLSSSMVMYLWLYIFKKDAP